MPAPPRSTSPWPRTCGCRRNQARTLINVLDTCTYPILIHCQWGSERTGLVSAITELPRPGSSLAEPDAPVLAHYTLHPGRWYDGAVDGTAPRPLRGTGSGRRPARQHAPEQFRHRISPRVPAPEAPSREEWPYAPYSPGHHHPAQPGVAPHRPTCRPGIEPSPQ